MKSADLNSLAQLCLDTFDSHLKEYRHPKQFKFRKKYCELILAKVDASKASKILILNDQKLSKIKACIMFYSSIDRTGKTGWIIQIFSRKNDRKAMSWIKKQLIQLDGKYYQKLRVVLAPHQKSLIKILEQKKVFITSIILRGNVQTSLRMLKKNYGQSLNLPEGLKIVSVRTIEDVRDYINLVKKEFTRNPQFGNFVASAAFLKLLRKDMFQNLNLRTKRSWVIKNSEKVIGGFEFSPQKFNGATQMASLGINLSQDYQGKGLAKVIYAFVLNEMKKQNFKTYKGGTAQPGVMKLSKLMRREPEFFQLESTGKPYFEAKHFGLFLK